MGLGARIGSVLVASMIEKRCHTHRPSQSRPAILLLITQIEAQRDFPFIAPRPVAILAGESVRHLRVQRGQVQFKVVVLNRSGAIDGRGLGRDRAANHAAGGRCGL